MLYDISNRLVVEETEDRDITSPPSTPRGTQSSNQSTPTRAAAPLPSVINRTVLRALNLSCRITPRTAPKASLNARPFDLASQPVPGHVIAVTAQRQQRVRPRVGPQVEHWVNAGGGVNKQGENAARGGMRWA